MAAAKPPKPPRRGGLAAGRYKLLRGDEVTFDPNDVRNVGKRTYVWVRFPGGDSRQVMMAELRPIAGTPARLTTPEARPVHRAGADPVTVLKRDREEAIKLAADVGVDRARVMLKRAQDDLNKRLKRAEGLTTGGDEPFSQVQRRVTLHQIEQVVGQVQRGMKSQLIDQAPDVSDQAVGGVLRYMDASERRFAGINERLPLREASLLDRARMGSESSLLNRLQGDSKAGPGILKRYGDAVIQRFEEQLQVRFLARKPWDDVRDDLIESSPFLQQAPASWAERLVRTEIAAVHGRASFEATREADDQLGDVVKINVATFDARTAADSYAVHGQIRRPAQAFETWYGLIQHPPDRSNDRSIMIAFRTSWPIPDYLKWKTDAEVVARWHYDGRKGEPPPRPKMTTVPLEQFGKRQPR